MAAIFSSVRSSHRIAAAGRGACPARQSMTRSGVTMKSSAMS
jgi:hypothetical protein